MVTEAMQQKIKSIFPENEVLSYAENEAYVSMKQIHPVHIEKLVEVFKDISGMVYYMNPTGDGVIDVIFKHVAFSN